MSWQDRLRETIVLTSPEGTEFEAYWMRSPRKSEKTLGVFKFPRTPGAKVQDLRVGATEIEMSIFFAGADNDIDASRFFVARREMGEWTINHPVYGVVTWYMVSVQEVTDPNESGNITEIKTVWLDADADDVPVSDVERASTVTDQAETVYEQTLDQMDEVVDDTSVSALADFLYDAQGAAVTVRDALEPVTKSVATVNAAITATYNAITTTALSATLDVVSLASSVQTLLSLPTDIEADLTTRLGYYAGLITSVLGVSDADRSGISVNSACVQELIGASAIAAMAETVAGNDCATREEALYALTSLSDTFDTMTTYLDANQTILADDGYVSMSSTYNGLALLVSQTNNLLLRRSFDLAATKTITLRTHQTPVAIALTEDVDLDTLISSNSLKGNDILLLSPGAEVKIYG